MSEKTEKYTVVEKKANADEQASIVQMNADDVLKGLETLEGKRPKVLDLSATKPIEAPAISGKLEKSANVTAEVEMLTKSLDTAIVALAKAQSEALKRDEILTRLMAKMFGDMEEIKVSIGAAMATPVGKAKTIISGDVLEKGTHGDKDSEYTKDQILDGLIAINKNYEVGSQENQALNAAITDFQVTNQLSRDLFQKAVAQLKASVTI